jgi:hypothetical protein
MDILFVPIIPAAQAGLAQRPSILHNRTGRKLNKAFLWRHPWLTSRNNDLLDVSYPR